MKKKLFIKRMIALIVLVTMLPFNSLEGCFVVKAQAAEGRAVEEGISQESTQESVAAGSKESSVEETKLSAEENISQEGAEESISQEGAKESAAGESKEPSVEETEPSAEESASQESTKESAAAEGKEPSVEETEPSTEESASQESTKESVVGESKEPSKKTEALVEETEPSAEEETVSGLGAGVPQVQQAADVLTQEVQEINLSGAMDDHGGVQLSFIAIEAEDIQYEIYRNDTLLSTLSAGAGEPVTYSDSQVEGSQTYSYRVEAKSGQNDTLQVSNAIEVAMPEALVVRSNYTLTDNLTVYSLKLEGGTLNLNGYTLKVCRDYTQTGGDLRFDEGMLCCYGDFAVHSYSYLYMNKANDYLYVEGDILFQNVYGGRIQLTNGVMEVKGNYTDLTANDFIRAVQNHKVIFSGTKRQDIAVKQGDRFQVVELQNYSEEGVYSDIPFDRRSLIRNGCNINYGGLTGEYGWILEEDEVHEGDLVLLEDTLDLNGHSLTVTGDLIQMSGVVDINKGALTVEGDYRIQCRTGEEDAYSYTVSRGLLKMTNEEDYVCVKGSFYTGSSADESGYLTGGTLEVKGNVMVDSAYSEKSFVAEESHTLLLSGEEKQQISFGTWGTDKSRLRNLEITNESEEGVVIESRPYVSGSVNDHGNHVQGFIVIGSQTVFAEERFGGSIDIIQNKEMGNRLCIGGDLSLSARISISGEVSVKGSCTHNSYGELYMNGGSLTIERNYNLSDAHGTRLRMNHEKDYLCVKGDVSYNPCWYNKDYLSAGTFEIGGNLTSTKGILASGSHRFLFSGEQKQVISIAADEYFAIVELRNHSEEGVYSENMFARQKLIRNGCKLTYGDLAGEYGWTLEKDEVYEGDLVLLEDTLDLNGHSLRVTGDLVQSSGVVYVNGGTLTVEGDYRIQSRTGEEGAYNYSGSHGQLKMDKEEDYICVKGSFYSATSTDGSGYLTGGCLEVKGDVAVDSTYSEKSFVAGGTHILLLSGEGKQQISFGAWGAEKSRLCNLEITNASEEGVVIEKQPYVWGKVNDHGNRVQGFIAIGPSTTFMEGSFGGSVCVVQKVELRGRLTVEGDISFSAYTAISGEVHVKGNCTHNQNGSLHMNQGSLIVDGNYTLPNEYAVYLTMNYEKDYVYVGGDVSYNPYWQSQSYLSAGTFEIRGNLTSEQGLWASGSHKFLFSGDGKQIIDIAADEYFAIVELQNCSEEGVYSENVFARQKLIRNSCKLTYGKLTGEYGWTLEEDEVYEGDLVLLEDTLDLNGHSLRVTGDLIQPAGVVYVNGGALTVEGDYRMQCRTGEEGAYSYTMSSGQLKMLGEKDYVCVKGSFFSDSSVNHEDALTAGTLEIKGDMTVSGAYSGYEYSDYSFIATGTHKLLLSGENLQTVSFGVSSLQYSRLADLEIANTGEGVHIENKLYVSGNVNDNGKQVTGYLSVGSTTTFAKGSFTGSVHIGYNMPITQKLTVGGDVEAETYSLSGELIVQGSYVQTRNSVTVMQEGRLTIYGDYSATGTSSYGTGIRMEHEKDYVHVYGNVKCNGGQFPSLTAGTFEMGGDSSLLSRINATGTHRFLFSGKEKQNVSLGWYCSFATVELQNYSAEGVYFTSSLVRSRLIRNGCRITCGDMEEGYGWQLTSDYICEGDLLLTEDTLDLNGYELIITGDFIHAGGELLINGGSLTVQGDYRMQRRGKSNGSYAYSEGSGRIIMEKPEDKLTVNGDFFMQTAQSVTSRISEGTIELQGSFTRWGSAVFTATGSNTIIFSGEGNQSLLSYGEVTFANMVNRSQGGLSIGRDITLTGTAVDEKRNITGNGSLCINGAGQIADGKWSGNVKIADKIELQGDLQVGGTLTVSRQLFARGYKVEASSITLDDEFYIQASKVNCINHMTVGYNGKLIMQEPSGYVLVGGNFTMSSRYNHETFLTAGTLEIRGHFAQNSCMNFIATGSHTVILSHKMTTTGRNFVQNISFNYNAGTTRFNRLVLKKNMSGYQFSHPLDVIAGEVIYDVQDTTAPTKLSYINVEKTTVTSVTLTYGGAEDESGVLGYEIYRNGKKVGVTSDTAYTDRGLLPGTTYTYEIYPFDAYRNMAAQSPKVQAATARDITPPTTPGGACLATRTGSSVTISWQPSTDDVEVAGYTIYRNGEELASGIGKSTYQDKDLEKNTAYRYCVAAYDGAGNSSGKSNLVEAVTAMPEIVNIFPSDYSSIGGKQVQLKVFFKNVGNSTGNKVKIEYLNENEEWSMLAPSLLGQKKYNNNTLYADYTWNIAVLTGEQDYTLRYTLYDADGNTDVGEAVYHIDRQAPKLPENISAAAENGIVTLTWEASVSADCAYYKLYRRQEGEEEYTLLAKLSGRYETFFADRTAQQGTNYTYAVTVGDGFDNESGYSEPVTAWVDEDFEAPQVKTVVPGAGRINGVTDIAVTASDNRGVASVRLQYRKEQEEGWKELAQVAAKDNQALYSLDTTGFEDGVYLINAVAIDTSGNESVEEFTRRYEIDNTGIAKIELTGHTVTATTVRLEWADVTENDFAYFQVEQLVGTEYVKIAEISDTLGCDVNNLSPETVYSFRVAGYDNLGNRGEPSQVLQVTTREDKISPTIEAVYPVSSYYKDTLALKLQAKDNASVGKAVFSYSFDKENYVEIATVAADRYARELSLSYDFDISGFEEGSIYVKFEVYDRAGNKNAPLSDGEEVVAEYVIDRTAPAKVENLKATGVDGYVGLTWNSGAEQDIKAYRIYRADAETGIFTVIEKECSAKNFYDTTVAIDGSYIYKVSAIDLAGNEGECSEEIFATVAADGQAPVVTGMSPANGERIGKNPLIKVLAMDNACLSSITLEYRQDGGGQEIWTPLASLPAGDRSCLASVNWNTEDLEEGNYLVRAVAKDFAGNVSEVYQTAYTLDLTPPEAPVLSVETGHYEIHLGMALEQEEDFAAYEIYRREIGSETYILLDKCTENTYTDVAVTPNTVYSYQVAAYDSCGNVSWSKEVEGYADDVDVTAPIAVLPENLVGLVGMELAFDGMGSTDNVRITKYSWNMGNGDVITGACPVYAYDKPGTYVVVLQVEDAAGNTAKASATVRIYDKTGKGISRVKVVSDSGKVIPHALVYMKLSDGESLSLKTDSKGYVTIAADVGAYCVAAYADGFIPNDVDILVSEYETKEYTLTLKEDKLIVGDLTVRRMTLEEMVEAGVDFSNPNNYNRFVFRVTLTFEQRPIPVTIEYIGGFGGATIDLGGNGSGGGSAGNSEPKITLHLQDIPTTEEEDVPILAYVTTTQSVSWLKEMYEVELGILNAADTRYVIEEAVASLNLPKEGVSLAKTKTGQSLIQDMGSIRGQERKSVSWIVKGDKSGSYKLSADFEGTLMPFDTKVSARFETEEEFQVSTGEGLHIYVMPESEAYIDETYYIQFAVVNESSRPFYNFTTSIGKYREPAFEYTVTDAVTGETHTEKSEEIVVSDPSAVSQSVVMTEGQKLTFSCLEPGDVYYGTYSVPFSGEGDKEKDYYVLIDSLVEALEGENTGVEVSIVPMSSHIFRTYWKVVEVPSFFGDPVDLTSGYYTDEMEALGVTGAGRLGVNLSYASGMADSRGELGYGWHHNYEMRVEEKGGILWFYATPAAPAVFVNRKALQKNLYGSVAGGQTILAEGKEYTYGEYRSISALMTDYRLEKNRDNTYTMYLPDGGRYDFDSAGRLQGITDSEQKHISLTHQGGTTTVTEDISGKRLYLNHNGGGLLTSVSDDNNRQTTFSYDGQSRLVAVTNPIGETTRYFYDEQNRIVSGENGLGTFVTNTYDEADRVMAQTDGEGAVTAFSYEENEQGTLVTVTDAMGVRKQAQTDSYGRILKVTDGKGGTTEYAYDSKGNLTCEKDAYGNCIFREYDAKGNLTKLTDTGNLTTTMTYDGKGNASSITNASGQTARYTYNDRNLVTSATDYAGNTTTYEYDGNSQLVKESTQGLGTLSYTYEKGLLTAVTDYEGNISRSEYDGAGNLIKTTDATGAATAYTFDGAGRITAMTDAMGGTAAYTYDCNGNLLTETDALGNTTRHAYDRTGRQTAVTYPDGSTVRYSYDQTGNLVKTTYPDDTVRTCAYDSEGNLLKETLPDGSTVTYTYDLLNQRMSETDSEGNSITYEYYPNGNLHRVTYPDGTHELYTYNNQWKRAAVTDRRGSTTSYEYDAMGNLTLKRDALGNTTRYAYDRQGRLVSETDPKGNTTTYAYDQNSNCTGKTNALGVTVHMTYDGANRMTAATVRTKEGEEYTIRYAYDPLGRVTATTDEEGNTTRYTYDAVGNVTSATDEEGNATTAATYDSMGRTAVVKDALGLTTTYTYDLSGNLTKAVQSLNGQKERTAAYTYDRLGRMTSATDSMDGTTRACYDERGNLSSVTDANGGTTAYAYDAMGRLTEETSPLGNRNTYTYNAAGLLSQTSNARGQETTYTYDAIGRITSMTDELGTVSYTYDRNGNVLTVTDGQGTASRRYDALNRVTQYTDCRGNTVKYAYDEIGNLISLTYPGGEIVRYTYYKNGLLHTVTDEKGLVTTYEYDRRGNLTRTVRPNKTEELCTYNTAGLLVEQKDTCGEEVLTCYTYTYDSRGNLTAVTGTETTEEGGITPLTSAAMTYDADNRLLTYNGQKVEYDADGNMTFGPVKGEMTRLTYDCRNRLIQAGDTTYTYDGENNRIRTETPTYVEEYVTDTVSSSLSRVLSVTVYEKTETVQGAVVATGAGSQMATAAKDSLTDGTTTLYVYGNGLIYEHTGDLYLYHHYNNLGSTMKLTDQRGEVIATYAYGTYGELLRGDTTLTRFLYNGRCGVETDSNGLYYMRQRYYSPEIKRFLNQDVVRGSLTASQSLNRYSYVQGNPVSYTDPFGLSPLNGLFTGTNFWHAVLGFIGCVPGPVGMVANLADAAVYALIDHDYGMAALAMLDCVSGGLSTLAKAASAAGKATKTARYLKTAGSLISNVSSFAQNASAGMATAFDMYEKYMIKGEKFDSSTPWEIASLGLSILGMGISGRGMAGDTKALSKMLNEDMISSRMSKALSRQMGGRQTGTPLEYNLQFFGGGKKGHEGSKDFGAFKGGTETDVLLIETSKPISRKTNDHHVIPAFRGKSKPYADFIADRGIDVDQYTITVDAGKGGIHMNSIHGKGGWNQKWMEFIDNNPNATAKDIYQFAGKMMDDYGLSGYKIHPYGRGGN